MVSIQGHATYAPLAYSAVEATTSAGAMLAGGLSAKAAGVAAGVDLLLAGAGNYFNKPSFGDAHNIVAHDVKTTGVHAFRKALALAAGVAFAHFNGEKVVVKRLGGAVAAAAVATPAHSYMGSRFYVTPHTLATADAVLAEQYKKPVDGKATIAVAVTSGKDAVQAAFAEVLKAKTVKVEEEVQKVLEAAVKELGAKREKLGDKLGADDSAKQAKEVQFLHTAVNGLEEKSQNGDDGVTGAAALQALVDGLVAAIYAKDANHAKVDFDVSKDKDWDKFLSTAEVKVITDGLDVPAFKTAEIARIAKEQNDAQDALVTVINDAHKKTAYADTAAVLAAIKGDENWTKLSTAQQKAIEAIGDTQAVNDYVAAVFALHS